VLPSAMCPMRGANGVVSLWRDLCPECGAEVEAETPEKVEVMKEGSPAGREYAEKVYHKLGG